MVGQKTSKPAKNFPLEKFRLFGITSSNITCGGNLTRTTFLLLQGNLFAVWTTLSDPSITTFHVQNVPKIHVPILWDNIRNR